MNRFELRLIKDWKWIATKAWSTRFIALAALLSGLEVGFSFFTENPPIARGTFALLSSITTAAALIARFVAQKDES